MFIEHYKLGNASRSASHNLHESLIRKTLESYKYISFEKVKLSFEIDNYQTSTKLK